MCEASAYKSNKEFLADVNLAKKVAHNKSKELNFTDRSPPLRTFTYTTQQCLK